MSNQATASPGYVKRRFDWQDDLDGPQKILELHMLLNKNIFTYGVSKHVLPCCNNVSIYVSMKRSKSVWKIGIPTSVFQSLGELVAQEMVPSSGLVVSLVDEEPTVSSMVVSKIGIFPEWLLPWVEMHLLLLFLFKNHGVLSCPSIVVTFLDNRTISDLKKPWNTQESK